jgi:hypothetical protein
VGDFERFQKKSPVFFKVHSVAAMLKNPAPGNNSGPVITTRTATSRESFPEILPCFGAVVKNDPGAGCLDCPHRGFKGLSIAVLTDEGVPLFPNQGLKKLTASADVEHPPVELIMTLALPLKLYVPNSFHWPPSAC